MRVKIFATVGSINHKYVNSNALYYLKIEEHKKVKLYSRAFVGGDFIHIKADDFTVEDIDTGNIIIVKNNKITSISSDQSGGSTVFGSNVFGNNYGKGKHSNHSFNHSFNSNNFSRNSCGGCCDDGCTDCCGFENSVGSAGIKFCDTIDDDVVNENGTCGAELIGTASYDDNVEYPTFTTSEIPLFWTLTKNINTCGVCISTDGGDQPTTPNPIIQIYSCDTVANQLFERKGFFDIFVEIEIDNVAGTQPISQQISVRVDFLNTDNSIQSTKIIWSKIINVHAGLTKDLSIRAFDSGFETWKMRFYVTGLANYLSQTRIISNNILVYRYLSLLT